MGGERAQLQAFLDDNRDEVAALLDGITEEQARRRLVPSLTSLASIVKHCAFVERAWFQIALDGRTRAEVGLPEDAEESWVLDEGDTVASLRRDFRAARRESDEIVERFGLDDLALHNRRGPLTVRWIYAHMIEELARHAGHGDILREQILADDGSRA